MAIVRRLKDEGLVDMETLAWQHSGRVVAVLNFGSQVHAAIPSKTRQEIERLAAQALPVSTQRLA